jgi:hypothetical protein
MYNKGNNIELLMNIIKPSVPMWQAAMKKIEIIASQCDQAEEPDRSGIGSEHNMLLS